MSGYFGGDNGARRAAGGVSGNGLSFRTQLGIARELLSRLLSMVDLNDLTMKKRLSLLPLCASLAHDDLGMLSTVFYFAAQFLFQ